MAEQMTIEQLISTFGEETGKQMFEQMNASSGGNRAPFTFLKHIAKHTSELGKFGEFVYGVEQEKEADGNYKVTNKGTNLKDGFEFVIVNVSYRYKRYVEADKKTYRSNIFDSLDGIKTAVDVYSGKPLPATKEDKKAMEWKLVRINGGLVRKSSKAAWEPVIWETSGAIYYNLGQLTNGQPNNGLLSGTLKVKFEMLENGSVLYPAIKLDDSSFGALPKDLFTKDDTKTLLGDITKKMTAYKKGAQFSGAPAAPTPQAGGEAQSGESGTAGRPEDTVEW